MSIPDDELLTSIRADLAAIEPVHWTCAPSGGELVLQRRTERGDTVELARFSVGAMTEVRFLVDAPGNIRFLLGMIARLRGDV